MKHIDLFQDLVENAIWFIDRSVKQFGEEPRQSLMNFCTGLELFLKARLYKEHWSLLYRDPGKADLNKFVEGDFVSPNFKELIERLNNIARANIGKKAAECFDKLRNDRNKLVHFIHNAFSEGEDEGAAEIVIENGRAWYYLYELISGEWQDYFYHWSDEIKMMNNYMHSDGDYLTAKIELIKPLLDRYKSAGQYFDKCSVCGKEAVVIDKMDEYLFNHELPWSRVALTG